MKKLMHLIFEKYGLIKMFLSFAAVAIFMMFYYNTGKQVFIYLMSPFVLYLVSATLILFTYAWIINPWKDRKERKQK